MDDNAAVTAYLAGLPETARERVDQIRAAVHATVPGLGEKMAYGVLTFTLDGRNALHTGGYAGHVAVYPVPDTPALADRVAPHRAGKGTLRFPHADELPLDLIEDVALALVERARTR